MKKILFIFPIIILLGCDNKTQINESVFADHATKNIENTSIKQQRDNIDVNSYAGLEDVFNNSSDINPNGKFIMMVFSKNHCPYCEKLKRDIKKNQDLRSYIKKNFTNYYVNISYQKNHKITMKDGDSTKIKTVGTDELSNGFYEIFTTPTIIFIEQNGDTIFEIPGYVQKDTFMKILQSVISEKWRGAKDKKDRIRLISEQIL